MKNYRIFIFIGLIVAFCTSFFSKAAISPIIIICAGLFFGIFLISLIEKENHSFLINLFTVAFFSRIVAVVLLYNLAILHKGYGLFGDAWCYSENGYSILQMWLSGITDFSEIHAKILAMRITTSGTLGSYDFWNAFVYFFTGKSPLSLLFINCLAGSLTILFVYQVTRELYSRKAAMIASLLTGFWPSTFMWSIQNLKEPISVLLICMLIWAVLCLRKRFRFYLLFVILVTSIALKEIRIVSFFVFYVIVLPISVLLPFMKSKRIGYVLLIVPFFIIGALYYDVIRGYLMKMLPYHFGENVSLLDWLYMMRTYRALGGSAFFAGWDFTNLLTCALFAPAALIVAWLAPFPWQLGSALQIMAMPEMLIYYLLIIPMFLGIKFVMKNKIGEGGIVVVYICVMLVVLAFIEGNIGTLFRHRAMVLPFMFVLTGIGVLQRQKRDVKNPTSP